MQSPRLVQTSMSGHLTSQISFRKNWSRDHNGFAASACVTLTVSDVQFVIASEGRVRQYILIYPDWAPACSSQPFSRQKRIGEIKLPAYVATLLMDGWLWVKIHLKRIFSYFLCTFALAGMLYFYMLHGTYLSLN